MNAVEAVQVMQSTLKARDLKEVKASGDKGTKLTLSALDGISVESEKGYVDFEEKFTIL
jgi:hypothetical protein